MSADQGYSGLQILTGSADEDMISHGMKEWWICKSGDCSGSKDPTIVGSVSAAKGKVAPPVPNMSCVQQDAQGICLRATL